MKSKIIKTLSIFFIITIGLPVSAEIEEVIVTAAKREQSLQEVPIAVSVIDGETIEKSGMIDLFDLSLSVPSMKMNQLQQSVQSSVWIRGFTNGANNPGLEPSVGAFIDGIPRTRSIGILSDLPDVERVEVLKGPQSTLFGKNSSVGMVSIITKKPTDEFEGVVQGTIGNENSRIFRGTISGPISDSVSYRVSGSTNRRDGFNTNLATGEDINDRDRWAVRGQLLADISDNLSARLIVDHNEIEELCCAIGYLVKGQLSQVLDGMAFQNFGVTDSTNTQGIFSREMVYNFSPTNELEDSGVSLQLDYDLDFADLTILSGLRNSKMKANLDADLSGGDLINEQRLGYEFDTFSTEVRLQSSGESSFQWTAGIFYSKEELESDRSLLYGPQTAQFYDTLLALQGTSLQAIATGSVLSQVPGSIQAIGALIPGFVAQGLSLADAQTAATGTFLAANPALLGAIGAFQSSLMCENCGIIDEDFGQDSDTLSIFANFELAITDQLSASVGLNYTENEKKGFGSALTNDVFANLPIPALSTLQLAPSYTAWPNANESGRRKSDDITHTVKLMYQATDRSMFYISHATGYKPEFLNANFSKGNVLDAKGESSASIEIGYKGTFEKGFLNIAVYELSVEDFQVNVFEGGGFRVTNAEEEIHRGIEIDSGFFLTENLSLGFSAAYTDAEYDEYLEGACANPTQLALTDQSFASFFSQTACTGVNAAGSFIKDLSGTTPSGVPEIAFNLNLTYDFNLGGSEGYARVEYYFEDEYAITDSVPAAVASREANDINASIGLESDGWIFNLWGRNLTDNEYMISGAGAPIAFGSFFGYYGNPRTFGLSISKKL